MDEGQAAGECGHAKRWEAAALAVALIWQELVFKVSTSAVYLPQLVLIFLFSLSFASVTRLALTFLPTRRLNRGAKVCVMVLAALVFSFEYFISCEFKHLYDLRTVFAGATDAAAGFTDEIFALVLSPAGLVHIALFVAPALAYALRLAGETAEDVTDVVAWRAHIARDGIVSLLVALLVASSIGTYGRVLTDRYSFQEAVSDFGLACGLARETWALAAPQDVSFEDVQTKAAPTTPSPSETAKAEKEGEAQTKETASGTDASEGEDKAASKEVAKKRPSTTKKKTKEEEEEEEEEEPAYGLSVLDIDFNALAGTTDGTWAELDRYVASLKPSTKNAMTGKFEGYNLVFVSAEALSAEAIRQDTTPTLWRMATKGVQFTDYYQFDAAGTTGGECANLFGLLATEGGDSVRMTADHNMYLTMGNMLNRRGYDGWAFHNNTHTYYGRDLTHNNLGYSNGYMGYGNGMEAWVAWQWPQSDLEMVQGTFENLYGTKGHEPFNVYYMSVSGHSGYLPGENAMADKHADQVSDLPYSDSVKGYLAANIELDQAMAYLIGALEDKGMADRTVIVLAADHFPYGLDDDGPLGSLPLTSELYGYPVTTYFERDHNRAILWSKSLEGDEPLVVDEPTTSLDLLPTLLNLFGLEWDSRLLPGRDVFSDKEALVYDFSYDWKSARGTYFASTDTFVAVEGATIPDDYVKDTCADVANRINYCHAVLTSDYFRHVFGERDDVQAVHDEARARLEKERKTAKEKDGTSTGTTNADSTRTTDGGGKQAAGTKSSGTGKDASKDKKSGSTTEAPAKKTDDEKVKPQAKDSSKADESASPASATRDERG